MADTNIDVVTLGRLLISECRYGYTRNNHLMPSCAYDDSKKILSKMFEADKEPSLHIAKQLCSECISDELLANFSSGLDDDNSNRAETINFIEYLLDLIRKEEPKWLPYNYDSYTDNLKKEININYALYKVPTFDISLKDLDNDTCILVTKGSKEKVENDLFDTIIDSPNCVFNKKLISYNFKVVGEVLRFTFPDNHQGEIYLICATEYIGKK